ncbi:BtrH N-terminal domain-containing protein [Paenibacillus glucanolyticus]|uniref:BtrH N-terminal domain-containing protein n=1 Tax=Paenibacillus glucanolyticus TaxID=59843 RepID=UPI0036A819D6
MRDFVTYQGIQCYIVCFQNYLRNAGVDIDEYEIFFLGNGFVTCYEKKLQNESVELFLRSYINESVDVFCKEYNLEYIKYKDIENSEAEELIENCISRNIPVILRIDAGCINYNAAFKNAYGLGFSHYVIVLNRSENGFLVSDGYVPTVPASIFQGEFESGQLRQARNARNNVCIIIPKEQLLQFQNSWNRDEMTDRVVQAINASILSFLTGGTIQNSYYGVRAMEAWISDLPFLHDYYEERFTEKMYDLYKKIRMRGFIGSRYLLNKAVGYLSEHKSIFGKQIVTDLQQVTRSWDMFGMSLLKIGIAKRKNDLVSLAQRANEIYGNELDTYNRILKYV